jgi:hypothetical protein
MFKTVFRYGPVVTLFLAMGGALSAHANAAAPQVSAADAAAIKQAALDYIEGWYNGDAARMERAVHPELAKRMVSKDAARGTSQLNHTGAAQLVQSTGNRSARPTPKEGQQKDVTILDVYENAASVKVVAADWIDYLHLAKWDGSWKIVNVLWELKPVPRKN